MKLVFSFLVLVSLTACGGFKAETSQSGSFASTNDPNIFEVTEVKINSQESPNSNQVLRRGEQKNLIR